MNTAEHIQPSPANASGQPPAPPQKRGFGCLQVALIVLVTMLVTLAVTWWFVRAYIFPKQLEPVALSQPEQAELGRKLKQLGVVIDSGEPRAAAAAGEQSRVAVPEPYAEAGARREVLFSERELNGLLANDPELAANLAIDLAEDLVSFTWLVELPPDFPVMPGRIVRVNGGAEVAFAAGRPSVVVKGVSLMGVPIPNAWLGGIKNIDLVSEFGDQGFWQAFAAGVENVEIENGELRVKLRE